MRRKPNPAGVEYKRFSKLLVDLLDGKGIYNTEIAGRVDVHETTVTRWRKGENCPNPVNLGKLASALSYPLEDLVKACQAGNMLVSLPKLPMNYVARKGILNELISAVEGRNVTILHGAYHSGKTTLAIAAARNERVLKAFQRNVVWVDIGELTSCIQIIEAICDRLEPGPFGRGRCKGDPLRYFNESDNILIVLDNAVNLGILECLATNLPLPGDKNSPGRKGIALLITTREPNEVAKKVCKGGESGPYCPKVRVSGMTPEEGIQMVRSMKSSSAEGDIYESERRVLKELGEAIGWHPGLLRTLAGLYPGEWRKAVETMRERDYLAMLERDFRAEWGALSELDRKYLEKLLRAFCLLDATYTGAVAASVVWNIGRQDVKKKLTELAEKGLVTRVPSPPMIAGVSGKYLWGMNRLQYNMLYESATGTRCRHPFGLHVRKSISKIQLSWEMFEEMMKVIPEEEKGETSVSWFFRVASTLSITVGMLIKAICMALSKPSFDCHVAVKRASNPILLPLEDPDLGAILRRRGVEPTLEIQAMNNAIPLWALVKGLAEVAVTGSLASSAIPLVSHEWSLIFYLTAVLSFLHGLSEPLSPYIAGTRLVSYQIGDRG